jgi:hypothetical protein
MFVRRKRETADGSPVNYGVRCPSCGADVTASVTKNFARKCLFCFARILDSELHIPRNETAAQPMPKSHFQVLSWSGSPPR